ncbi:MAG: transketolase [Thermoguttaceae bacterium]
MMNPQEKKAIDTIRVLAADAVQKANSGHPGTPMALAPITYLLYNEVMTYDPADPAWPARDKFVLSVGHASMLLYATLHLAGVKQLGASGKPTEKLAVSLDDIKTFRQWKSRCAGHPEFGHTSGVEITTGPLGQGLASSVGMAVAAKWFAGRYNSSNATLFGSNVYALCGDGCMMEGVSSEAASLAGHLKLDNLCWIYDDNGITIEGHTDLAMSEDVAKRFDAYGWNVVNVADVNDLDALRAAFRVFKETTGKPTLIIVKSVIGYGAPKMSGKHEAHGAPLGEDEIKGAKKFYGLPEDEKFVVAPEVYELFARGVGKRGADVHRAWNEVWTTYKKNHADLAAELEMIAAHKLPAGWDNSCDAFPTDAKGMASRISSGKVLNKIAANVAWLLGGSADLAPSNKSDLTFLGAGEFSTATPSGRNFHFGIREHAMGQIVNGLTVSGLRGYCATFFVFADYMRPAIRAAALMKLPSIFLFTHDSIGVGEDGPTHQPIEHLASLRAMPNVAVFRPADANEVTECYKAAMLLNETPSVLVMTRQNLPTIDRTKYAAASNAARGGYVLADAADGKPDTILLATGSEVGLCLAAYEKLTAAGKKVRVVSLPCWELFEQQSQEYRDSVLPPSVKRRVGVEMACDFGWAKWLGDGGKFIGLNHFGDSAPAEVLFEKFGFTVDNLCKVVETM